MRNCYGVFVFILFILTRCTSHFLIQFSISFHSLNGSLPNNVEIKNNTLFFKGPVTYDLAGTYVCDATNSIGTRSGRVEVNVTGRWLGLNTHLLDAGGMIH